MNSFLSIIFIGFFLEIFCIGFIDGDEAIVKSNVEPSDLGDMGRSGSLIHNGKVLHLSKKILQSLLKPIKILLKLLIRCVINLPDFLHGLVLQIIKLLLDFHNLLIAKTTKTNKSIQSTSTRSESESIYEIARKLEILLEDLLGALNSLTSLGGCIKPIKKSIKPVLSAIRFLNSRDID
jgi:hypothetical protein